MKTRLMILGMLWMSAPAGAATVTLDWDAVTKNADCIAPSCPDITDLAGYRVFHRTSLLPGTTASAMSDAGVTKTQLGNVITLTLNNLTDGTSYYFRVTARDNAGNQSAFSLAPGDLDVDVSTFTPAPAAPSGVGATAVSPQRVDVSWTDGSTGEAGFRIERSVNGGAFALLTTTAAVAGTGSRTYQDATVSASTTYAYRVRANGTSADSAFGGPASATTPAAPTSPPPAPVSLTRVVVSSTQVNLSWPNVAGEDGFHVERSLVSNFSSIQSSADTAADALSLPMSGLSAGTTYYFRVRAFNVAGNSAYVSGSAVTQPATVTIPPAGFKPPPALKEAYAYPNPASGVDPVLRGFMGGVDQMEVTIFDAAGRVAHSGRTTTTVNANGETAFEYRWTGEKAPGVYYAVMHGKKGEEVVRARAKFAVIR